jgi:hypothetical protein
MFVLYATLVLFISILLVIRLRERALYLLFAVAFTQNFALAYLYTNGLAGKDLCRSLILFKEFLLLELFVYVGFLLYRDYQGRWPRPLLILLAFTAYCVIRFTVGAVFYGDLSSDGLHKLRMMSFPIQILTVAAVVSWSNPTFAKRFMRHITYLLAGLALVGIVLFLFPAADFWKQHADVAVYNMDVKGDDPSTVLEDQGVSGTGAGREAFLFLSAFRAMGTFADPLSFGFAMAMPIVLLAFYYRRRWYTIVALTLAAAAIFFSFSRSSWIFVAISFGYLWLMKRKYLLICGLAISGLVGVLLWPPLAEFAAADMAYMSWSNPSIEHAQGIVWFYQKAFVDPGNIFGKGMDDNVQSIPESGYAFVLEHFGLLAYAFFVWFCFSLFMHLRRSRTRLNPLTVIAQAVPVCVLIVMHTSQYPFAFIEYLFIWFVVGICMYPAIDAPRPLQAN